MSVSTLWISVSCVRRRGRSGWMWQWFVLAWKVSLWKSSGRERDEFDGEYPIDRVKWCRAVNPAIEFFCDRRTNRWPNDAIVLRKARYLIGCPAFCSVRRCSFSPRTEVTTVSFRMDAFRDTLNEMAEFHDGSLVKVRCSWLFGSQRDTTSEWNSCPCPYCFKLRHRLEWRGASTVFHLLLMSENFILRTVNIWWLSSFPFSVG